MTHWSEGQHLLGESSEAQKPGAYVSSFQMCPSWTGDVAALVECLPGLHEALSSTLSVVFIPVTPVLWRWRQEAQKFKSIFIYMLQSEVSLDCLRVSQKQLLPMVVED